MSVKAEMEKTIDAFTTAVMKLAHDLARDSLIAVFSQKKDTPISDKVIHIVGNPKTIDKTTSKIIKAFAKQTKKAAKKVIAVAKDAKWKAEKKAKKARKLEKKANVKIAKGNKKAANKASERRPKEEKKEMLKEERKETPIIGKADVTPPPRPIRNTSAWPASGNGD
jgi:hypothetical protein